MTGTSGGRTYRSASDACAAFLPPSYVCTGASASGPPRGSRRLASSRGDSSHDDASGDGERAVRAAFECHLAVVRAILGVVARTLRDGAPRRLEVYSRDRHSTTACGTFVLGLGTIPEDAQRQFGGTRPSRLPASVGYFGRSFASHIV